MMKYVFEKMDTGKLLALLGMCVSGLCFLGSCARELVEVLKTRGITVEDIQKYLGIALEVFEKIAI